MSVGIATPPINESSRGCCLGIRHIQSLLLSLALILAFVIRVNMSMAVVAMTEQNPELFDWSTQTRSTILSSFIWGYPVLCIPAGLIVSHFGGKTAILISISINCITCFLMPTVAYRYNWQGICVIRIVQGVSQGFIMPGLHAMLGKWAPLEEKSQLGAVVYAGAQFGSAFALSFSGMIADSIWGWPSIFYGTGLLVIIFLIFWTWIASNRPRDARFISLEEIDYIESSIGVATSAKISTTPFFAILTSMPFWAIVAAHITQNWGFWTLLTGVPLYTRNVLGVNLSANGILSSLPYYVLTVVSFPCARIVDIIIKRKWLSITAARKVSNTAGHWLPACGLIALAYTENTIFSAVSYLTLTTALNVGHFSGFMLVHIDIAPNYAGTLMGFTNCFANLVCLLAPLSIGFLVQDESLGTEWRKVFLLAAGVYFLGNLFFITFATSKRQKWNKEPESYGSDDIHTAELRKELEEETNRRKSESRIISKVSS